ncbi:acyl carrier protein [candidate division KSB3 bacterium]|uniref:Acyl carrier protein n=1 Tax=candidate division KSB3 bacterium TaxID=2044937 RepID=A0A9D5K044_9BACT|nr:acyl carrier protein [candidate division KSB3 bacterium]MBD3327141.1 acyl carrier protein [candidate division KSB3 bacterium]
MCCSRHREHAKASEAHETFSREGGGRSVADAALKTQLKEIISKATGGAIAADQIGDDVSLMDLGVDSMAALEVVMELESQFGVSITDMEAGKEAFSSINSLAAFVETNKA